MEPLNYIHIPDAMICYLENGSGPPIIFIHGFCLDHRMWEYQFNFFSATHTVISVDLRGFGNSSLPSDKPYSHHEDIKALLDGLQIIEPIILVGLSMGARVISNFALCYPQKTRAVIFVDGIIDGYVCMDFNLDYINKLAKEKGVDPANEMWLAHPLFESARKNTSSAKLLKEMVTSYSGWHWKNKNPTLSLNPPAIERLEKLTMPALIITGEYDIPDFQAVAQILSAKIVQSLKKQIEGAGHMCNMEMPIVFNEMVNQFLVRLP